MVVICDLSGFHHLRTPEPAVQRFDALDAQGAVIYPYYLIRPRGRQVLISGYTGKITDPGFVSHCHLFWDVSLRPAR